MRNTTLCIDSIEKCGILGVSQVIAQIENSSIVVHGPKGCVYPAYEASILYPLNINYTEMCEKTIVFGGEVEVSEKIIDEFYENQPDLMAVVTTCASEIIGDDIDGLIKRADLPIPVLRIDGGGFLNNQTSGMNMAMRTLVEKLCKEADLSNPTVNILSPVSMNSCWQEDMTYLVSLLAEFGIMARPLFCNASVEQIGKYAHTCLNVVICPPIGFETAEYMKKAFKIPYITLSYPLGMEKTEAFIKGIAETVQLNKDITHLLDEKRAMVKSKFHNGMGRVNSVRLFEYIKQLNKMIVGPPEIALAFTNIITKEYEDSIGRVIVKDVSNEQEEEIKAKFAKISPGTDVLVTNDNQIIKEEIQNNKPQVLLGSDLEYYFAKELYEPAYINITYPGARELNFHKRPFLGYDGTLNFFEVWYNKIINRYY
ncbi:light-independent protochlorophyllide reductase subunit B [Ruminiclostridium hungatei]|uniref:Light-independent protochlorophyllide reductase subunit B n=1 Tax=Ruminiclostridium hungatei TaxID=48256 RepID=A0A1V4SJ58_RUMHU|nr:nitrogenase component 1 [Ruminiclostridium hungatei]OPX43918.1 light-independent protochlorophyllide reductase subunit B [Ruminiclostridium hungatei]